MNVENGDMAEVLRQASVARHGVGEVNICHLLANIHDGSFPLITGREGSGTRDGVHALLPLPSLRCRK